MFGSRHRPVARQRGILSRRVLALEILEQRNLLTVYNVGADQAYATLGSVPWSSVNAGDTVAIHWQPTPYREKFLVSGSGTVDNPINIVGIPGPAGQQPVIDGQNATTDSQFAYPSDPLQNHSLLLIAPSLDQNFDYKPSNINIQGLEFRNANSTNGFTNNRGEILIYDESAAAVYIVGASNITLQNNTFINSGLGVFVASGSDGAQAARNIMVDGNSFAEVIAPPAQAIMPPAQAIAPPDEPIMPPPQFIAPPDEPIAPPDEPIMPPPQFIAPPDEPIAPPDEPITTPPQFIAPPDEPIAPPDEPIAPPDEPIMPPPQAIAPPDEPITPPDEPIMPPPQAITPPDEPITPPDEPIMPPPQAITPTPVVAPPVVISYTPGSNTTEESSVTTVTATFSESIVSDPLFTLTGPDGISIDSTETYVDASRTATLTPSTPLAAMTTYTVTISNATDSDGNTLAAPFTWSFTTASAAPTPPAHGPWDQTSIPGVSSDPDSNAVELGLKFSSSVAGTVTGVRFYKGDGNTGTHLAHLWASDGTLLATATFTNESNSGWQQVSFSNPVVITPGATYVVSYYAPNGNYSFDIGYFTSGFGNGPLNIPDNAGVFAYGQGTRFPGNTWLSSNYWVDVTFTAASPATQASGDSQASPTATSSQVVALSDADLGPTDPGQTPRTLTYTATAQSQLYWLDQTYGLYQDAAGYDLGHRGQGEKYLRGTFAVPASGDPDGDDWYYILPNGDLYQYQAPLGANLTGVLVARLGAAVYDDPSLLWNALNTTVPVSLALSGNQLTITPSLGYEGTFVVVATVGDGQRDANLPFLVTVLADGTVSPVASTTETVTPLVPVDSNLFDRALARWKSQMIEYGRQVAADMHANLDNPEVGLTYYDATRVFYQIADYTGDSSWLNAADDAIKIYRDSYVLPQDGGVPGYWNFTDGLAENFRRTGNAASRDAVLSLAQNAAFAPDSTPTSWTATVDTSREVAYNLMAELDAESLGAPHRARTDLLADQALSDLDQWTVSQTAPYVRPFMVALTCEALIDYQAKTGDARVLPAIRIALDWIWAHCWDASARAFQYTNITAPDDSGGTEAAPDLNLLIAPAFGWVYHQTGDTTYRDRGDAIFAGGVDQAWLAGAKQFDQNYRWSFDYVKWRTEAPLGS